MSDFGDRLKLIRQLKGFTQQCVADELGVSLRTYQRYEEGSSEPSLDKIVQIADFFGVLIDWYFDRDEVCRRFGVPFDESQIDPPDRPIS